MGCCLYILLCACHPFDPQGRRNDPQLAAAIAKGQFDRDNEIWPTLSASARDLIERMLDRDPCKRITAAEVRLHPWFVEKGEGGASRKPLPTFHAEKLTAFRRLRLLLSDGLGLLRPELTTADPVKRGSDGSRGAADGRGEAHGPGPQGARAGRSRAHKVVEEVFASIDADGNGSLSKEEVFHAFRRLGYPLTQEDKDYIWQTRDAPEGCTLSQFKALVGARLTRRHRPPAEEVAQELFGLFDIDHTQGISLDEFRKCKRILQRGLSDATVRAHFTEIDTDGDGVITKEEFVTFLYRHHENVQHSPMRGEQSGS
jgi:calcium-dependent protein kinase